MHHRTTAAILVALTLATVLSAAAAQIGLPTLSQPIPPQLLNRGQVELDLRNYFGVPGVTGQVVQFATSNGRLNVELHAAEAPRHVANFLAYVSRNGYDNTIIHRVDRLGALVPAIVQGGGYQVGPLSPAPPSIPRNSPVALEYGLPNVRGALAAGRRAGEPNSATSEWFINTIDNSSSLGSSNQGGYTVFGRVLGTGMSIVDQIAQTATFTLGAEGFDQIPLRNVTPTQSQFSAANLVVVSSVRAIPIYPPTLGDPTALLHFTATSASPTIVAASVTGSVLTLMPLSAGTATVTVQAVDTNGNTSPAAAFAVTIPSNALLAPSFTAQPVSQVVIPGSTVVLSVSATGGTVFYPTSYQWLWNGAAIPVPDSPFLIVRSATKGDEGSYSCIAKNAAGSTLSSSATLAVRTATPGDEGRLVNLAINTFARNLDETVIVGFSVGGGGGADEDKPLLVRAVGPSLAQFGIEGALADPVLSLHRGAATLAENDNWFGDAQIASRGLQVGAFPFISALDAAFALSFAPGAYTVQIKEKNGGTGNVLAEIYDASERVTSTTPRLVNGSARGYIGPNGEQLVVGFVIGGSTSVTVLIRAIGPTLTHFGLPGALSNPQLQLFRGPLFLRENDDWGGDYQLETIADAVGAFALPGRGSKDAALLVTLSPGSYTAQVSSASRDTGIALIELYEVR